VAPLRHGFPGGTGDAEATTLASFSDANGEAVETPVQESGAGASSSSSGCVVGAGVDRCAKINTFSF
jgi:hypothetical protein